MPIPRIVVQLAQVNDLIAAPKADVWAVLADFAHPQRLAPTISRCTVSETSTRPIRIVESSRGPVIHERLLECDFDSGRFRYEVLDTGDMPFAHVTSYDCTVTLMRRPDGATDISWSSVGDVDGPIEPVRHFLTDLYRRATERIRQEVTRA